MTNHGIGPVTSLAVVLAIAQLHSFSSPHRSPGICEDEIRPRNPDERDDEEGANQPSKSQHDGACDC